jgi:hypothetical protein
MKMKGIDDLKKWSEETATYSTTDSHPGNQGSHQTSPPTDTHQNNNEVDLLGLDIGEPAPKLPPPASQTQNPGLAVNLSPGRPEAAGEEEPAASAAGEGRAVRAEEGGGPGTDGLARRQPIAGSAEQEPGREGEQHGPVQPEPQHVREGNRRNPNMNIQNDDDDFFALIASKKNQLLTKN